MLGTLGRGDVLLGDRAYDSDALRQDLATRGARANVRLMPNRVNLPPFNKRLYRRPQSGRTFLQQTQAFPRRRDPIRQTRRQLSRIRQARLNPNLDAL